MREPQARAAPAAAGTSMRMCASCTIAGTLARRELHSSSRPRAREAQIEYTHPPVEAWMWSGRQREVWRERERGGKRCAAGPAVRHACLKCADPGRTQSHVSAYAVRRKARIVWVGLFSWPIVYAWSVARTRTHVSRIVLSMCPRLHLACRAHTRQPVACGRARHRPALSKWGPRAFGRSRPPCGRPSVLRKGLCSP